MYTHTHTCVALRAKASCVRLGASRRGASERGLEIPLGGLIKVIYIYIYIYIERERETPRTYIRIYIYIYTYIYAYIYMYRECLGPHRQGTPGIGNVYYVLDVG